MINHHYSIAILSNINLISYHACQKVISGWILIKTFIDCNIFLAINKMAADLTPLSKSWCKQKYLCDKHQISWLLPTFYAWHNDGDFLGLPVPCVHSRTIHMIPHWMLDRDEFGGGETPKNFGVLCPPTRYVLLHFKKEFSKVFKIWSFMSDNFFLKNSPKFSKNFLKFSQLFQNRKKLLFL